jgi:methylglutaconyl-CoA hydratase
MTEPVLVEIDNRGVATVTLNRPEVGNAYNGAMIEGLLKIVEAASSNPRLRAVLLRGTGKHFQAGADLKWIGGVSKASADENERVSRATAPVARSSSRRP